MTGFPRLSPLALNVKPLETGKSAHNLIRPNKGGGILDSAHKPMLDEEVQILRRLIIGSIVMDGVAFRVFNRKDGIPSCKYKIYRYIRPSCYECLPSPTTLSYKGP